MIHTSDEKIFFFFIVPAPTEIYTLSLHDALPILPLVFRAEHPLRDIAAAAGLGPGVPRGPPVHRDRKSTRLNSSHPSISYAVFCLKKKKAIEKFHHDD